MEQNISPNWLFKKLGLLVRISDHILQATAYVGLETQGVFTPSGTCFFAAVHLPEEDMQCTFLVTAKHVIDDMWGDKFWVRLNRKSGGCSTVMLMKADAIYHTDKKLDLIMFAFHPRTDVFETKWIPLKREMIEESWKINGPPSVGDEVVMVGLYTSHFGLEHNTPVARFGHIAMLPIEPVWGPTGSQIAYLVEIKSMIGLSGSPAYVNPFPIWKDADDKIFYKKSPFYVPMGMCIGYHRVTSVEDVIQAPKFQGVNIPPKLSIDERNTGLALVIPFERILEIVERDDVMAAIQQGFEIMKNQKSATFRPASAAVLMAANVPPASDENPTHLEDFNRLLDAASQKPKQAE